MSKYKTTAITRLLIFLIILLPILYVVSSYINGEDGIANIKSLVGGKQTVEQQIQSKEKKIDKLENEIRELKDEIEELKR